MSRHCNVPVVVSTKTDFVFVPFSIGQLTTLYHYSCVGLSPMVHAKIGVVFSMPPVHIILAILLDYSYLPLCSFLFPSHFKETKLHKPFSY